VRLTTKGRYGVRIVLDIAQHQDQGPVSMLDISQRQGVSMKYLERIVGDLRRAGFVNSMRGRNGGHQLARAPENITVGDIVRAMENGGVTLACGMDRLQCDRSAECLMRSIWIDADQAVFERLDSVSILDILRDDISCLYRDAPVPADTIGVEMAETASSHTFLPGSSEGLAHNANENVSAPLFGQMRRLASRRLVRRRVALPQPEKARARKILVVDDDPVIVDYLTDLFRDDGYEVCSAADGSMAMAVLRRELPDLITLDLEMPGAWGPRFYARFTQIDEFRHIPVVVISGLSDAEGAIPQALATFPKPFDPEAVLRVVRKAIG